MKQLARKAKPEQTAAPPRGIQSGGRIWLLALVVLLTGGGAWAFAEFVVFNKLPAELVGKWVVEGGEQDGATFDFYRGGSMLGRINVNGREGIVKARVEVEGDRLFATTQNPRTGELETRTQTIVRLTRTHLTLRDERGAEMRMFRADD